MKTTKRILSLALCLMLVLSLAATAFAVEAQNHSHTITIKNIYDGYTYTAYQIFAGDLGSDGVLSNVSWGSGVDGDALLAELQTLDAYKDCTDAKMVSQALSKNDAMDDPDAIAFAQIVSKHVTNVAGTSVYANNQYTISGLDDGYYLVVNTSVPDEEDTTYSRYILEVVRDITVTHKGDFPDVEKKIIEQTTEVDVNEASIGEAVYYEITGTMPDNIEYYNTYYYAFTDTLSKGLTYNEDLVITVNGVVATDSFAITASDYSETDGTTIKVVSTDLKSLADIVGEITDYTEVILTYSATVNTNAEIGSTANPNKVYLEYDNNPNDDGTGSVGKTPEDEVETYVTELTILKKDGAGKALTGAEFTLSGDAVKTMIVTRNTFEVAAADETATYYELNNGTFTDVAPTDLNKADYKSDVPTHVQREIVEVQTKSETVNVKAFVGEDGYLTFTGLGAGIYTLTESVTPDGFNTIAPITFRVTFNPNTKAFSTSNRLIAVEADNTLYSEIINVAGTVLPSTGGMGTTLFYILGGLMVAGAAVLLVTKKRMGAEG